VNRSLLAELAAASMLAACAGARPPAPAADPRVARWQRIAGLVTIPTTGADRRIWLCRRGEYVEANVCGGWARGRWSAGEEGIRLAPDELCVVGGYDWYGASAECARYRIHYLVGCFPPAAPRRRVAGDDLLVRTEPWTLPGDAVDAMADGLPPPAHGARCAASTAAPCREDARWTWRLEPGPEPKACDPRFQPANVEQLGPFAPPDAPR
jgi:hypothetical protein